MSRCVYKIYAMNPKYNHTSCPQILLVCFFGRLIHYLCGRIFFTFISFSKFLLFQLGLQCFKVNGASTVCLCVPLLQPLQAICCSLNIVRSKKGIEGHIHSNRCCLNITRRSSIEQVRRGGLAHCKTKLKRLIYGRVHTSAVAQVP